MGVMSRNIPRLAVPLSLRLWGSGQRPLKAGWKKGRYLGPGHPPEETQSSHHCLQLQFGFSGCLWSYPEGCCMEGGDTDVRERGPWRQSS